MTEELRRAVSFASLHVGEGARELIEMKKVGILPEGKVRELSRMVQWSHNPLDMAESLFVLAALTKVAAA